MIETLYPNAVANMRSRMKELGHKEYTHLPLWMRTPQTDTGSPLGFVLAVPICYTKPGKSALVKKRIEDKAINFKNIDVIVGNKEDLYSKVLFANNLNWSVNPKDLIEKKVDAKIRYRSPESSASIRFIDGRLHVLFDQPQRSITPGQAIVFYNKDKVLGGGWIDEVLR